MGTHVPGKNRITPAKEKKLRRAFVRDKALNRCKSQPPTAVSCQSRKTLWMEIAEMLLLVLVVFFDFDAEGFKELQVLIVDLEFRVGGEGGDQGGLVRWLLALLADADRGFQNQENVVPAFFNAGHYFRDLFGVGKRFINGVTKLLHQLLELRIHAFPPRSFRCYA